MRFAIVIAVVPFLLAGCADRIPLKTGFATTALTPSGDIPPEFAAFNNYDPGVGAVVAGQLCAGPDRLAEQKDLPAVPGKLVYDDWRCPRYVTVIHAATGLPAP